jgi:hypothetical protein
MMSTLARRGALAALITITSIAGCKCGSQVTTAGCASDSECVDQNAGNTRWFCDKTKAPPTCALQPKQCDTAADCCPGQVCNAQGHYCFDKYTPCSVDGSCPASGQVCETIGVFVKGQGCTFNKCATDGTCASGTACFNKYCVSDPPCNGGCSGGKVCITATNLCSPPPADASCKQTCGNGKMLVLTNPDNIFDLCNSATETCECDSLPPLQTRDVARYSSMAVSGNTLYVSAYDGVYQDLVVHTFDKNSLAAPQKSQWVDGVPSSGTVGGDTNGPRGGITDPGPRVGRYTSIAATASGDLYVSYYDEDNGDLKFAARYGGPLAPWTVMTVDGSTPVGSAPSNGDLGLYTSIALMTNGTPAIAYFRRGSYDSGAKNEQGSSTALIYAVATKVQPLVAADWKVIGDLDTLNRPPPPCNNGCRSSETCIDDPNAANGQRCAVATTACAPACTATSLCVKDTDANGSPVCRTTEAAATLAELPQGTGLMPSLAFMDDHPVIAYYDSINQVLKAVQASGTGLTPAFGAPVEIDGHDTTAGATQRDTGRFPALAISSNASAVGGRIAIAFGDRTAQQLLIYQSSGLTAHAAHAAPGVPGLIHVVDDGRPAAGEDWHPQSMPGAQTSVAFTPSGKIALAYQDATPVNLVLASYDPATLKTASRTTVRSTGSAGFYPHLSLDQAGAAFVSSATIKEAPGLQPANHLTVDQVQTP